MPSKFKFSEAIFDFQPENATENKFGKQHQRVDFSEDRKGKVMLSPIPH